jgi:Uma2 family endonuclease
MAESTDQYDWIVLIKENLERLFADRPDVFIAGDLFWYPVPDRGRTKPTAPDVLVAFGRPKGRRPSYKQWEEAGIAPQVVFEVWSPSNEAADRAAKLAFYEAHGVEEFYGIDPETQRLEVWLRTQDPAQPEAPPRLRAQSHLGGWTSHRLGVRFATGDDRLELYLPSGEPFLSLVALDQRLAEATAQAKEQAARAEAQARRAEALAARSEQETTRADAEHARAEAAELRMQAAERRAEQERLAAEQGRLAAERERRRAERLALRLRTLGINPDDLDA